MLDEFGKSEDVIDSIKKYYTGVAKVLELREESDISYLDVSLDEYRDLRAGQSGAEPYFALISYYRGRKIEPEVLEDALIVSLRREGALIFGVFNDMMSFRKEFGKKELNIVEILMRQNQWTLKQSLSEVADMLVSHVRAFSRLFNDSKEKFSEKTEVVQFLEDIELAVSGLCQWHVLVDRYSANFDDYTENSGLITDVE